MSLIEKAAKRLEELRRSGIEIPSAREKSSAPPLSADSAGQRKANHGFAPFDPTLENGTLPSLTKADVHKQPAKTTLSQSAHVEIDLAKLAANGFVTPNIPRSRVAEEFRDLKRTLIANAAGKIMPNIVNGNLVMVTSSLPGEGKTFSALNLAMSIAMELDRTVLLVDADVARPSFPNLLGLPAGKGLLDVLQNKTMDLSEVLLRTNIDKLTILPSGMSHANATELLSSDAMIHLLNEVANRYADRIIIFDSPPLLLTTESRVLATHMGQIVFVVNAENTLQRDVMNGLATIDACPVKMMLLNQARATSHSAYGYGYQGYGS